MEWSRRRNRSHNKNSSYVGLQANTWLLNRHKPLNNRVTDKWREKFIAR